MARRGITDTVEEVLALLAVDEGAQVYLEESSSDDEDIFTQAKDGWDDDYDYEPTSSASDDDDDDRWPPTSTLRHKGRSSTSPLPSASVGQQQPAAPTPTSQQRQGRPARRVSAPLPQSSDSSESPEPQPKSKGKAPQKKRVRGGPAVGEDGEQRWHNKVEKDTAPAPFRFMPARPPGPTFDTTASWSLLQLFQLFFSTSVVRTIIENTNANAAKRFQAGKKLAWKLLDVRDFYIFLAILIWTGLMSAKVRADHWRKIFPYTATFPSSKMKRDRFESILWSLHMSNPKEDEVNEQKRHTAEHDRLFKIKPLYTEIVTACKAHFQPYENICIDERMVASKAHVSIKQYMKDKPTKWGYKLYVLADSATAYTWNFFVYQGKSVFNSGQRLTYSSVIDLLPFSLLGGGYKLFVDNYYTSPALFLDLSHKHMACCGNIRTNRIGYPKAANNALPKTAERGDMRWIREDKVLFVQWMDTRRVTMCSTIHEAFSGRTINRKVKEGGEWQVKAIPVPNAVLDYNKSMGGVDLSDALIGYYTVLQKTRKWYKTLFFHFVDVAVVNSFLLHKELCKIKNEKPLTQKVFREKLLAEMIDFAEGQPAAAPPPPPPPLTCMPMIVENPKRQYCKFCQVPGEPASRNKTGIYCRKCQVFLCLTSTRNCFQQYHDSKH